MPDGLQDDVQLGHIVLDGHGGYTLFQSEIATQINWSSLIKICKKRHF